MTKYIDADAFERKVMFGDEEDLQDVIYSLRDYPAADVKPVVRGEWIEAPDKTSVICSHCKADWNVFDNDTYRFNFCPNCGARMEES